MWGDAGPPPARGASEEGIWHHNLFRQKKISRIVLGPVFFTFLLLLIISLPVHSSPPHSLASPPLSNLLVVTLVAPLDAAVAVVIGAADTFTVTLEGFACAGGLGARACVARVLQGWQEWGPSGPIGCAPALGGTLVGCGPYAQWAQWAQQSGPVGPGGVFSTTAPTGTSLGP